MAQSKIWTNWNVAVFLSLLSSVSLTIASNVPGCNDTGIEITMTNTSSSGNLTSPNYPDRIPANSSCIWILTCPPGRLIKLYFNEVMFNNSSNNHSYLEIRDGAKASGPLIINITAGESKLDESNSSVPFIYSSGQKVSLYLKKGLGEATGSMCFRISYSYIKSGKSCSANNSNDENNNILLTPPFLLTTGADLPSPVDCTWKIAPSIKGILMNITLNIENNLFCRTGSVSIFDGPYGPAGKLKHNLCQEPGGVSGGSSFTSDVGLSFQLKSSNFNSVLQINASEDDCIIVKTGINTYMTKNSLAGKNLSRTQCQRKFSNPSGPLIFNMNYLKLPHGCENNSVQLFELHQNSSKSKLRAKFCETLLLFERPSIVIYSGQALIKVQTEAASNSYGFSISFQPAGLHGDIIKAIDSQHCSEYNSPERNANLIRTAREGYITSVVFIDNFPYPPGMLCRWIIRPTNVTEKEQIKMKFLKFGFTNGYDKDCAQDHVQLDFGNGKVQRYCKATGDPSVVYSGEAKYVNVTFVSTPLYTGNYGFSISYDVVPIAIVPSSPPRKRLSWTVIGVLIGAGCLLLACIAFGLYRCKRRKRQHDQVMKRQHDRVMQRMANERDEQEDILPEEELMATPTPQGPPPPYTGIDENSQLMQQHTEDQPYPWFSPGTTIMEHSPRERRPGPEMESKA